MCPANHSSPMVAVNHHRQAAHGFWAAERHKFSPRPQSRRWRTKALLTGSCCWSRRLGSIGRDQLCLQSASPKGRGPPSHNENPPTSGRGGSLTTRCVDIPPQGEFGCGVSPIPDTLPLRRTLVVPTLPYLRYPVMAIGTDYNKSNPFFFRRNYGMLASLTRRPVSGGLFHLPQSGRKYYFLHPSSRLP